MEVYHQARVLVRRVYDWCVIVDTWAAYMNLSYTRFRYWVIFDASDSPFMASWYKEAVAEASSSCMGK